MKIITAPLLLAAGIASFCCFAATTFAQQVVSKPPWIAIQAQNLSGGGQFESLWESGWGSYIRDTSRTQTVEIRLNNRSGSPVQMKVLVIFVARTLNSHQRFFWSLGEKEITLIGDTKLAAACPPIPSRDTNLVALGERNLEGATLEGWMVEVIQNDPHRLLASAGSLSSLESLASSTANPEFTSALAQFRQKYQSNPASAPQAAIKDLPR